MMRVEDSDIEFWVYSIRSLDEDAPVVPSSQMLAHSAHRRSHLSLHQPDDRWLFLRLCLAEGPIDQLARNIQIATWQSPHDLFRDIDVGGAVGDDDLFMLNRVANLWKGGDGAANEPLGLPRCEGKYSSHTTALPTACARAGAPVTQCESELVDSLNRHPRSRERPNTTSEYAPVSVMRRVG